MASRSSSPLSVSLPAARDRVCERTRGGRTRPLAKDGTHGWTGGAHALHRFLYSSFDQLSVPSACLDPFVRGFRVAVLPPVSPARDWRPALAPAPANPQRPHCVPGGRSPPRPRGTTAVAAPPAPCFKTPGRCAPPHLGLRRPVESNATAAAPHWVAAAHASSELGHYRERRPPLRK